MSILKEINDNTPTHVMSEEEEVTEKEISNILAFSGYEPGSDEWKDAMFCWKRRRTTNPRLYRKFVELD
jgi:hypothetical protein